MCVPCTLAVGYHGSGKLLSLLKSCNFWDAWKFNCYLNEKSFLFNIFVASPGTICKRLGELEFHPLIRLKRWVMDLASWILNVCLVGHSTGKWVPSTGMFFGGNWKVLSGATISLV